ncbi:DNA repair protein RecN [Psychromicrobium xiongbiense]|uniref:DNA repair protein RecN n=1 Tax=Psychromicrobium xiongbiense TaxID=3051184 RepID=UPI002557308C|nr:DNA repair protein RecN [Psychromicrobium sp. YIM S02556]
MIEELRIRDLGVITEATVPLGPGLTVVTGETGAGKTMVVTAVGLLLGGRSDSGAVRLGAATASAEATVLLSRGHRALDRAEEAGAVVEDAGQVGELLLARSISAEGRSRAYLGGRTVPVATLAAVGEELVVVHGQSDQIRLRGAAAQRQALDAFGGEALTSLRQAYRQAYERWRTAEDRLASTRNAGEAQAQELERLTVALAEIDAVDPQPGEDRALKAESLRLANLESLRLAAGSAHEALSAEEFGEASDATSLVDAARRAVEGVADHDPALSAAAGRLQEVGYLLADIAAELASYLAGLDAEALSGLGTIEDRRGELAVLVRKYGALEGAEPSGIDEVIAWAQTARARLDELDGGAASLEQREAEAQVADAACAELAARLSEARQIAAARLSEGVTEELRALAMPQARLLVELRPAERAAHGADDISFELQPHPGAAPRPLGKGASGGELSRVMLAVEVVLAAVDPVPTFVFDEVDAGVGGKAAVEIGRRLARLARTVQVLVVTHLPQVASFADQHLRVLKTSEGALTSSDVAVLEGEDRVRELARMLAGQEDSESAQAHARELLEHSAVE